jgi:hypothetical protein
MIEKKANEVRVMIKLTQDSLKQKARNNECIYCQLSLLKALEKSNLISIPWVPNEFKE